MGCQGRNSALSGRSPSRPAVLVPPVFASSFESKLERLSYCAPALVAAMLEDFGCEPSYRLDVLDAGCGTGLCGALVKPFARRLIGVDLSQGMLAHARDKNVYDALTKAELREYLHDNSEAFDLIVSADTLVYFGDILPHPYCFGLQRPTRTLAPKSSCPGRFSGCGCASESRWNAAIRPDGGLPLRGSEWHARR